VLQLNYIKGLKTGVMPIVVREGEKMKWNVGCDLNITEGPTVITQVTVK